MYANITMSVVKLKIYPGCFSVNLMPMYLLVHYFTCLNFFMFELSISCKWVSLSWLLMYALNCWCIFMFAMLGTVLCRAWIVWEDSWLYLVSCLKLCTVFGSSYLHYYIWYLCTGRGAMLCSHFRSSSDAEDLSELNLTCLVDSSWS